MPSWLIAPSTSSCKSPVSSAVESTLLGALLWCAAESWDALTPACWDALLDPSAMPDTHSYTTRVTAEHSQMLGCNIYKTQRTVDSNPQGPACSQVHSKLTNIAIQLPQQQCQFKSVSHNEVEKGSTSKAHRAVDSNSQESACLQMRSKLMIHHHTTATAATSCMKVQAVYMQLRVSPMVQLQQRPCTHDIQRSAVDLHLQGSLQTCPATCCNRSWHLSESCYVQCCCCSWPAHCCWACPSWGRGPGPDPNSGPVKYA